MLVFPSDAKAPWILFCWRVLFCFFRVKRLGYTGYTASQIKKRSNPESFFAFSDIHVRCDDRRPCKSDWRQLSSTSNDSSSSSSSSDSSDESSVVGLQKASKQKKVKAKASKAKAQAKRARPAEPAEPVEGQGEDLEGQGPAPSISSLAPKSDRTTSTVTKPLTPTAILDRVTASHASLKEITPWLLWTKGIKEKEFDQRVTKAVDLISKCEGISGNAALSNAASALSTEVDRVSKDEQLIADLVCDDLENRLDSAPAEIAKFAIALEHTDLVSFLGDLVRRLCDSLMSSGGKSTKFFSFLEVKVGADTPAEFCLQYLNNKAENSQEIVKVIVSVQQSALSYFMDRFRSLSNNLEAILLSIPKSWYMPEITRLWGVQGRLLQWSIHIPQNLAFLVEL